MLWIRYSKKFINFSFLVFCFGKTLAAADQQKWKDRIKFLIKIKEKFSNALVEVEVLE